VEPFNLKFTISPNVIDQEVLLGETVLMDVKTLRYFGLTSIGTILWREMQIDSDLDQVFARVVRQCELSEVELAALVRNIVNGMAQSGLIRLEPRRAGF